MAYEKINFVNQATPLNANNLNHMEDGIAESDIQAATLSLFESMGWTSVENNVISSLLAFIGNKISQDLWQISYPVGSYYETSKPESEFNPNTAWGGTWVLDSKGKVTVSMNSAEAEFDTLGETGGSKYIQAHTHGFTQPKITSYLRETVNYSAGSSARPFTQTGSQGSTTEWAKASGGVVGAVSGATTGNAGNLQPYIVVNRWHRTA